MNFPTHRLEDFLKKAIQPKYSYAEPHFDSDFEDVQAEIERVDTNVRTVRPTFRGGGGGDSRVLQASGELPRETPDVRNRPPKTNAASGKTRGVAMI